MKNSFKNLLLTYEALIVRCMQFLLLGLVLIRWIENANKAIFIDFRMYLKTAKLIYNGISPYFPEVYKLHINDFPPLQPPSMSLLFMPLSLLPTSNTLYYIYYIVSCCAFVVFVTMVFNYYGFRVKDYLKPKYYNLPVCFVAMLIFISIPFLHTLYSGQNSCFVVLCLFFVLFYPSKDRFLNIFLLGLSAAMKYSLLTFLAPVLIVQKRLKMSVLAFILFGCMVLAVGFWLNGPIPSLMDYIRLLIDDTKNGFNSYENANFEYLFIGFFRSKILNLSLKCLMVLLYFITLFRIWKNRSGDAETFKFLSATEWCLFSAMTLCVSYHRKQDGLIFLPFLGVIVLKIFYEMSSVKVEEIIKLIIGFSFLVFWTIPTTIIVRIASWIGKFFPYGKSIFYYSMNLGGNLFPILQSIMILTICYLCWLEFFQPQNEKPV